MYKFGFKFVKEYLLIGVVFYVNEIEIRFSVICLIDLEFVGLLIIVYKVCCIE